MPTERQPGRDFRQNAGLHLLGRRRPVKPPASGQAPGALLLPHRQVHNPRSALPAGKPRRDESGRRGARESHPGWAGCPPRACLARRDSLPAPGGPIPGRHAARCQWYSSSVSSSRAPGAAGRPASAQHAIFGGARHPQSGGRGRFLPYHYCSTANILEVETSATKITKPGLRRVETRCLVLRRQDFVQSVGEISIFSYLDAFTLYVTFILLDRGGEGGGTFFVLLYPYNYTKGNRHETASSTHLCFLICPGPDAVSLPERPQES